MEAYTIYKKALKAIKDSSIITINNHRYYKVEGINLLIQKGDTNKIQFYENYSIITLQSLEFKTPSNYCILFHECFHFSDTDFSDKAKREERALLAETEFRMKYFDSNSSYLLGKDFIKISPKK